MNYEEMALELLKNRNDLLLVPISQQLSALTKGVYFVLNYLYTHDDAAYPKELSSKMAVSSARIAALLNHMEKKKLVIRSHDPHDNRQIIVSLTQEGRSCLEAKRKQALHEAIQLFMYLGPEDAAHYLRIQRRIVTEFAVEQ